jgi:hypothetical protein
MNLACASASAADARRCADEQRQILQYLLRHCSAVDPRRNRASRWRSTHPDSTSPPIDHRGISASRLCDWAKGLQADIYYHTRIIPGVDLVGIGILMHR